LSWGGFGNEYEALGHKTIGSSSVPNLDMKLEVVVFPVSDVDRAKTFYSKLGWRLDADRAAGGGFRLVQFTPWSGYLSRLRLARDTSAVGNGKQRKARSADRGPHDYCGRPVL
jgi:catechol 2,3-dioxygenase-like lactoylglutathione lyase family enzyme